MDYQIRVNGGECIRSFSLPYPSEKEATFEQFIEELGTDYDPLEVSLESLQSFFLDHFQKKCRLSDRLLVVRPFPHAEQFQ